MSAARSRSRSPWIYVGCGCVGLVLVVIGVVLAGGYFGYTSLQRWADDVKDPVVRDQKVRQMLGAERLPEGYHAHFYLRVPFLFEMAVLAEGEAIELASQEPEIDLAAGQAVFVYFDVRDFGDQSEGMRRFLAGETDELNLDIDTNFDFRPSETLSRGHFASGEAAVTYTAQRGSFRGDQETVDGIFATALFDCPGGPSRMRFGIWFQRSDDPASELTGTPADEGALQELLVPFDLCADGR